jgi:CDP-glucose 4,6-dehydratase
MAIMNSFPSFYRGKKVLVTGHTGFKGGWLVSWLKTLGAQVVGFALSPDTQPNLFEAACVNRDMISVTGDVRDLAAVTRVFQQHSPEIVFHNAAQPLVRRSYRDPVATYATNVMGTVHALEAVRQTPSVRAAVVVTSDKAYENREWFWPYREEDAMGGHDPYSSSKGCAELVSASYRMSFFSGPESAGLATARAGNVMGGGDWSEDRLIPDIVRAIAGGKAVVIRQPDSVRPWQHVLEPLRGYLMLAQKLFENGSEYAEAWNFGPRDEDAVSVRELAKRVISSWKLGELKIDPDPNAAHEAQSLRLSTAKARSRLGWQPALSLDEAIEWTVDWYNCYYRDPRSSAAKTEEQIRTYSRIAFP